MIVNESRNVNDALINGLQLVKEHGVLKESRNGHVLEVPSPVCTVYTKPTERVLLDPVRDCNPFFHFMESMWMLAGRNDTAFVTQYAKQIQLYSTDGTTLNGAYGHRWRNWFGYDQLKIAIDRLKKFPNDRRTVISMWDPKTDLTKMNDELDHPCNTAIYLYIRSGELDMTVTNRSNDMLWGAYGANAVHFSFLHEFLASMIGVGVGKYYQFSNNFHVYTDFGPWEKLNNSTHFEPCPYAGQGVLPRRMVSNRRSIWKDLSEFCEGSDGPFSNTFIQEVAVPIRKVHSLYKSGDKLGAYHTAHEEIEAADWKLAVTHWINRRL